MLIKSICVLFVGLVTIALSSVTSNAGRVVIDPPAGANWADHAEKYLTNYRENRPFDRRKDIKNPAMREDEQLRLLVADQRKLGRNARSRRHQWRA